MIKIKILIYLLIFILSHVFFTNKVKAKIKKKRKRNLKILNANLIIEKIIITVN
jgi:hypothetical protein